MSYKITASYQLMSLPVNCPSLARDGIKSTVAHLNRGHKSKKCN
jgi:hypothetical protein